MVLCPCSAGFIIGADPSRPSRLHAPALPGLSAWTIQLNLLAFASASLLACASTFRCVSHCSFSLTSLLSFRIPFLILPAKRYALGGGGLIVVMISLTIHITPFLLPVNSITVTRTVVVESRHPILSDETDKELTHHVVRP